ncbi:hypothetical protein JTB14_014295 [Gonioctena quinquepunctata]|nr:hypothetical protein JTB14_014295 [Gonioctena quinquepunctata]
MKILLVFVSRKTLSECSSNSFGGDKLQTRARHIAVGPKIEFINQERHATRNVIQTQAVNVIGMPGRCWFSYGPTTCHRETYSSLTYSSMVLEKETDFLRGQEEVPQDKWK